MDAQKIIAGSLSQVFRRVFVIRQAQARTLVRAARALRLATRPDIDRLTMRADLALGRARRYREEAESKR